MSATEDQKEAALDESNQGEYTEGDLMHFPDREPVDIQYSSPVPENCKSTAPEQGDGDHYPETSPDQTSPSSIAEQLRPLPASAPRQPINGSRVSSRGQNFQGNIVYGTPSGEITWFERRDTVQDSLNLGGPQHLPAGENFLRGPEFSSERLVQYRDKRLENGGDERLVKSRDERLINGSERLMQYRHERLEMLRANLLSVRSTEEEIEREMAAIGKEIYISNGENIRSTVEVPGSVSMQQVDLNKRGNNGNYGPADRYSYKTSSSQTDQQTDQNKNNEARRIIKPAQYDGKTNLTAYLCQFEMVSSINKWSDETKAIELAVNLRGAASDLLSNISPEKTTDYQYLKDTLIQRFEPENQKSLYVAQLKNRIRRKNETIPELASDLQRLIRLAHPDFRQQERDQLALDYLGPSLNDSTLMQTLSIGRPKTLKEAISMTMEAEANMNSLKPSPLLREIQEIDSNIIGRFANINTDKTASSSPRQQKKKPKYNAPCRVCGSFDHWKRECPNVDRRQNHPYNKYHNPQTASGYHGYQQNFNHHGYQRYDNQRQTNRGYTTQDYRNRDQTSFDNYNQRNQTRKHQSSNFPASQTNSTTSQRQENC